METGGALHFVTMHASVTALREAALITCHESTLDLQNDVVDHLVPASSYRSPNNLATTAGRMPNFIGRIDRRFKMRKLNSRNNTADAWSANFTGPDWQRYIEGFNEHSLVSNI